jgi:flagellar basal-body rod protein FlgG
VAQYLIFVFTKEVYMWNGYYTAASGMLSTIRQLDIVSNNLANISTPAYKKDKMSIETVKFKNPSAKGDNFNEVLNNQARISGVSIDFEPGSIKTTTRELDLALLNPKGFFAVKTENGIRYTRDGEFYINDKGVLTNKNGYIIMSKSDKPIKIIGTNNKISFSEKGDVYIGENLISTLKIVDFKDRNNLKKEGKSLFAYNGQNKDIYEVKDPQVRTGALERSNVSIADAMVEMIKITRMYEFQQRVMDTILTDVAKKTTDEVGKP